MFYKNTMNERFTKIQKCIVGVLWIRKSVKMGPLLPFEYTEKPKNAPTDIQNHHWQRCKADKAYKFFEFVDAIVLFAPLFIDTHITLNEECTAI